VAGDRGIDEHVGTRTVLVIAGVMALIATPVSAARLDPTAMVLRKADVPKGYSVLRANTGLLTNAKAAQGNEDLLRSLASWRRLTGYNVEYDGGLKGTIASRVDVFRRPAGARSFLAWLVVQIPRTSGLNLVRLEPRLGDQAFLYQKDFGATLFVVVEWRYRNVCALLGADGLGVKRTIALARVQQRRIVTALG
jgi:hypothetical protein